MTRRLPRSLSFCTTLRDTAAAVALLTATAPAVVAGDEPPTAPEPTAQATIADRITALEIAVSSVVTQPIAFWRLGPLRAEADALVRTATDEAERTTARRLGERIGRFAQLADRAARQAGDRVAPEVRSTSLRRRGEPEGPAAASPRRRVDGHDAVGRLREVVSKRPDAPKFALIDDRGELVTLVSPAPGVDLTPLLGRRVGLDGSRGFIPEYRREHLTASRVTPLATTRR